MVPPIAKAFPILLYGYCCNLLHHSFPTDHTLVASIGAVERLAVTASDITGFLLFQIIEKHIGFVHRFTSYDLG